METNTLNFVSHKTIIIVAAAVLSLFITFYESFSITRHRYFVYITFVVMMCGLVVFDEMPGVVLLLVVVFLLSIKQNAVQDLYDARTTNSELF